MVGLRDAILNRVVRGSLTEKLIFEQIVERGRKQAMQTLVGKTFQAEGIAGVKTEARHCLACLRKQVSKQTSMSESAGARKSVFGDVVRKVRSSRMNECYIVSNSFSASIR